MSMHVQILTELFDMCQSENELEDDAIDESDSEGSVVDEDNNPGEACDSGMDSDTGEACESSEVCDFLEVSSGPSGKIDDENLQEDKLRVSVNIIQCKKVLISFPGEEIKNKEVIVF